MSVEVVRVLPETGLWGRLAAYAEGCPWIAGPHLADMLRGGRFSDWEAAFAALDDGEIVGFCTFLREDYYPDQRYWPWISSIFVDERVRGRRISGLLIEKAEAYARACGFARVYIPSDIQGLYEKYGYAKVDELVNYGGDVDSVYMKEL